MLCVIGLLLVSVIAFFYLTARNTKKTLKAKESNWVKTVKMALTLVSFGSSAALSWHVLPNEYTSTAYRENNPARSEMLSNTLHVALTVFIASMVSTVVSYLANKITFPRKEALTTTSKKLRDELETVIKFLKGEYCKPGDNKEACIQFTKQLILYYLEFISKESKPIKTIQSNLLQESPVLKNMKSKGVPAIESISHSTVVNIPETADNSAYESSFF